MSQAESLAGFEFDPFSFATQGDPYPAYRTLRDYYPAYRNPKRGFWALSRFEDVQRAARDWRSFSNADGVELDEMRDVLGDGDFLNMDPPRHDALRAVVHHAFAPSTVARLSIEIREQVRQVILDLCMTKSADLAADLAWQVPLTTIIKMLGFPAEDIPQLRGWLFAMSARTDAEERLPPGARDAAESLTGYFEEQLAIRNRRPRLDMVTEIGSANVDGKRLTPREALGMTFILFLAGIDTSAGLLSSSLFVLSRNRLAWQDLVDDPGLVPAAIEELLRFESPVQSLTRTATCPIELHGELIPEGARVLLLYGSANRDERVFPEPDRLDFQRQRQRHLAFGDGIHFCLGAHLARLEARITFEEFLRAIEDFEIIAPTERYSAVHNRGFMSLPARLSARPSRAS